MEWKDFVKGVEELQETVTKYLEMYEDKWMDFLRNRDASPEDNLQKELILELLDHTHGICHLAQYISKGNVRTGVLYPREDGELEFEGKCLPLMMELEVLIHDEALGCDVWTRAYVGGCERKYLVGIDKKLQNKPMSVRIRE